MLAPNAQVSLYPWKENDRKIALAFAPHPLLCGKRTAPSGLGRGGAIACC